MNKIATKAITISLSALLAFVIFYLVFNKLIDQEHALAKIIRFSLLFALVNGFKNELFSLLRGRSK